MIRLEKAFMEDVKEVYELQIEAFQPLLNYYQDYKTNPGAENMDKMTCRFQNPAMDIYFIYNESHEKVGIVRVTKKEDVNLLNCIAILPKYQNKGYAQQAIRETERMYPHIRHWELDTIKQECKLIHLYKKLGYELTGKESHIQEGMNIVDFEKIIL